MKKYINIDGEDMLTFIYHTIITPWIPSEYFGAIVHSLMWVIFWTVIAGIMHRFKIYIRL
jgi:hypothetical protein